MPLSYFCDRNLLNPGLRIGLDPRSAKEGSLQQAHTFWWQASRCVEYRGPIKREVALGTFDDGPIRHHARVAHPAGNSSHLYFALLANDILKVRQPTVV